MIGLQTPRIFSVPEYGSSTGVEAIELCELAGLVLDPWQRFVLTHALGERADGRWAAFEVGLNVARQNGKDAILEARELAGLFLLGERMIIHSAHMFDTSLEHFRRLLYLIENTPDLDRRVMRVSRSHGEEGIELRGGQRIRFRTRTKGGGRGYSGDLLILNEAMILPDAFMGALLPILSAQSVTGNPQVWYAGSPVDQLVHEHGFQFARVRARGIKGDPSLAYFEHSAAGPDGGDMLPDRVPAEVASSVEAWAQANPGLGIRISEEHIQNEQRSMGFREFAVERLGVGDYPALDGSGDSPISLEAWDALVDELSRLMDPVALAFDVSPDRSTASIGVAGSRPDGKAHVEVVEHRSGTRWVAQRVAEIVGVHDVKSVAYDGVGPSASLVPELEGLGIELTTINTREHAAACGLLFDAVDQDALRHLGSGELRAAVRGASKRPLGDAWAWSRKGGTDISPLVAVTLALWASAWRGEVEPVPMVAYR